MTDELTTRRQRKCAESSEGHVFPFDRNYGTCVKCLLKINPPAEKIEEDKREGEF